ncbi:MAG: hypothetical protein E7311_00100 [Clostridiales bacterium]|nr:hypothetical protein [Clostridiales bacterium]
MAERFFHKIIKEICSEKDIRMKVLSFGMIIKLKKDDKIRYIIQNCFGFNNSTADRLASDKYSLFEVLESEGISVIKHYMLFNPVSRAGFMDEVMLSNTISKFIDEYGAIAIVKSNTGREGVSVYKCIGENEIYDTAYNLFKTNSSISLCPYYDIKEEYRVVYLDGKCELIYSKERPAVIGNGLLSVAELYLKQKENLSPYITMDKIIDIDLSYVPKKDEKVYLTWKHNLCNGAIPLIVEDNKLKKKIQEFATLVAKKINIDFAAIDIIEDKEGNLSVLEVNSGLGLTIFTKHVQNGYEITKSIYSKAIDKLFE